MNAILDRRNRTIEDPAFVRNLFNSTKLAWIWIPVRLFLAYQWLSSSIYNPWSGRTGKLFDTAGWMGSGQNLQTSWKNAVAVVDGRSAITFDWYRSFIQMLIDTNSHVWFSKLIVFGEIAVGIGLLLGLFTGIAAWGGTLMNFNFIMMGSASSNGLLFGLEVFVVLAWKVAGYYGLDRWVLPSLGVPWKLEAVPESARPTGEGFQMAPQHN